MTGLEFLSTTIGQFIWPVLILVVVLIMKEPIKRLASSPRLAKVKATATGIELEFHKELDDAERELGTSDAPKAIEAAPGPDGSAIDFVGEMARLAKVNPRAVVMESHTRLEGLLRNSVDVPFDERRLHPRYLGMGSLSKAAVSQRLLTKSEASVINELSYLRNRVAHEPDHVISEEAALRYVDLTATVAAAIRLAGGQTMVDGPLL